MKKFLVASWGLFSGAALAQQGLWEQPPFRFGNDPQGSDSIQPVHLIHMYTGSTGKVVAVPPTCGACPPCWADRTRLWSPPARQDPPTADPGVFEDIPLCRTEIFCGGHSALKDGRILFVGGNFNFHWQADLFDPTKPNTPPGNPWDNPLPPQDMNSPRFYPTATTLPDGRVLVSSGRIDFPPPPAVPAWATTPEIYTPSSNAFTSVSSAERWQFYYPFMFVLPDGNIVDAGPDLWNTGILMTSTWTWGPGLPDPVWPNDPPPPHPGHHGSAVMYEPGKVMVCGGSHEGAPAVRTTFMVDLNNANPLEPPAWLLAGNMHNARQNHNLVILPDGKVLAVGGNVLGTYGTPVFEAEIFDPASGAWSL